MNPKKITFLFTFLILMLIIVEVQQIVVEREKKMLTSAEIKRSIQTKYPGDIKDIKFNKIEDSEMYVIDLHGQNRAYSLKVDAYSGEILYLNQMKQVYSENYENIEGGNGKIIKRNTYLDGNSIECSVKGMKGKKT